MADLIAQGADHQHRWRRTLLPGHQVLLGRAPNCWPTSWDDRVSRQHASLVWDGERLKVRALAEARNPIFVRGRAASEFEISPGEHFVIGQTTFTLADERVAIAQDLPQPVQQQTFSSQYLQKVQFRHSGAHVDVLARLPEVISGATSDAELSGRLVNLLLTGLPRAGAAALVSVNQADDEQPSIEVLHWDRRLLTGDDQALAGPKIVARQQALDRRRDSPPGKRAARVELRRLGAELGLHAQPGSRLGVLHSGRRQVV